MRNIKTNSYGRAPVRLCWLLVCSLLAGCFAGPSSDLVGKPAPAYTQLFMLDDEPIILEHLRGKYVVLLFWAAACNESQTIMDELNDYMAQHGRAKNAVAVAVSIDKPEDLPKLRERINWGKLTAIRHVYSGNEIYDPAKVAFEVDSLPSVFVINPDGVVIAVGSRLATVTGALGD